MLFLAAFVAIDARRVMTTLLVQNLLFVAVAIWYWRRQRLTTTEIGIQRPTVRQIARWLGYGIGVFAAALLAGALIERACQAMLSPQRFAALIQQNRQMSAEGDFLDLGRSLWMKAAFVAMGTLVAPIGEEALFRGVIYWAIRRRYGIPMGMLGGSLLFAIVHVSPLIVGGIFIIGLLLTLAYERTGSLWAPILMHAVNNGLMFALLWHQVG